ncbi:MAG TPA: hypothetical protein VD905_19660 [Flavobacteriales bacterium]|nr:hypothetical protein [Flavobacteriales bacterium]
MTTPATTYPSVPAQTGIAPVSPNAVPMPAVVPAQYVAPYATVPPANAASQKSSIKETVIYGLIGVAGAGITFLLLRKVFRDFRSGLEEKKSMDTGSEANTAKQINKALYDYWTGTDEEELRRILSSVKSQQQWQKIGNSYHSMYNKYLMTALEEELSTTEFNEMNAIINSKPDKEGGAVASEVQIANWAKRLNAAVNLWYLGMIPGTDEAAIKAVFMEIPSQSVYAKVAGKYEAEYGTKWLDDLKGDMDDWDDYIKIITAKPH